MKLILIWLFVTLLAGCAGLNVTWNASYNMPQTATLANPALLLPKLP
jgi:hypothetical protein